MKQNFTMQETNENEVIKLQNGWMAEGLRPHDYSDYRYHNSLAKVRIINKRGKIEAEYLQRAKWSSPLYFDVSDIKKNDILRARCWNDRKHQRDGQMYYLVREKTEDAIELQPYRVCKEAFKAIA